MFKKFINIICCIGSLFCGAVIYVVFRPKSYISEFVFSYLSVNHLYIDVSCNFLEYYLVDYLWAFSMSCGLIALFGNDKKYLPLSSSVAVVCGIVWEIMQKIGVVGGTGDILDVFMYLLAGITAIIINLKEFRK